MNFNMAERKYFTIVTNKGQIKIANAMVYGQTLNISTVVVGDGNGTYYVPTSDMASIKNEVWRGTISKTEILQDAQKIIRITTVIPAEVSGFVVREIGLLDEDDELVAIGNVPDLPKVALQDGASTELKLVMRLAVKNTEVFSFTIDPHTVIMTKDMLDMHDIDENAHQELLDKKADKTTMTTELEKKVDKTAMATELEKKANTNHTHNYAGSSSAGGSATSAVKLQTTRTIDGMNFNGSANITHFGVCSTAADVAEKTVSLSGFVLTEGARVAVFFANSNTHSNPKLNVNSTGAKAISCIKGSWAPVGQWEANQIVEFVYYSSHWIMITANARRLYTARTLALGGDVTGSTSFDGSANKTITATLANSGVKAGTYGANVMKLALSTWISNNRGLHSTTATSTWTAKQDFSLSFRYTVSSESASYDYLNITAAGTQILANTGGTATTNTLTTTLKTGQTIIFNYRKDGSNNTNEDCAKISEVKVTPTGGSATTVTTANFDTYFTATNGAYAFLPLVELQNKFEAGGAGTNGFTLPCVTVDTKGRVTSANEVFIMPSGVSVPVSIAQGGTGATTASAARTALGAFSDRGGTIRGNIKINGIVEEGSSTASGNYSHAEGSETKAENSYSHAEGVGTIASGYGSHAEGSGTTASGNSSHAEGIGTTANGLYSHAEGKGTTASDWYTHAEGNTTTASKMAAHAEGWDTTASGSASHAEGIGTTASGYYSHAGGEGTKASGGCQTAIGKYNKESTSNSDLFIIGNGSGDTSRSNCLRVTNANGVYSNSTYKSSGADYAEFFQWFDDNPNNEDRVGLFVTLDGEKIRLAEPEDDYILGIVSGCPSILGDVYDDNWKGMYETDIYGRPIFEEVEVPAETMEVPDPENPEQTITKVICKAHKEIRQKLNPNYDPTQEYIPRSERPEWDAVGMMGKLVVIDDGTCKGNGWCTVGNGGIATNSEKRTKYRVMARLDKTHVKIMIL